MNITLNRTVDLSSPILPEVLSAPLYEGEKNAHTFVIAAVQNKLPHPLSGSVVAYFERADGNTVRVEGEIIDGTANVTLPAECYKTGTFYFTIMIVSENAQTVIYAASGRVKSTQEGEIINGGDAIPTYDEIMAHLNKYLNANISAKVEQREDGALITLTDADGTTQAFVKNGKDGSGTGGGSGESGKDGATFTPNVDAEGNLSWTNDKNLPNPRPVNIKGPQGNKGEPGKSAYEIAIENGFEGTEEEWLYRTDNEPYVVNYTNADKKLADDFNFDSMVSAYKAGRAVYLVPDGKGITGVLTYLNDAENVAKFLGGVGPTWFNVAGVSKGVNYVSLQIHPAYTLPTMSESIKGGAKVGAGLKMNGDALTVDGASTENAGKLLYVDDAGTLQPLALGEGLQIVNGVLISTGTIAPEQPEQPEEITPMLDDTGNLTIQGYTAVNTDGDITIPGLTVNLSETGDLTFNKEAA